MRIRFTEGIRNINLFFGDGKDGGDKTACYEYRFKKYKSAKNKILIDELKLVDSTKSNGNNYDDCESVYLYETIDDSGRVKYYK